MSNPNQKCSIALKKLQEGNAEHIKRVSNPDEPYCIKPKVPISPQRPYAAILSCADSRVIPENIFSAGEGDLFVVRVAGNIANTSSVASLEFAVEHLHVRVIVVLGHESCGAVEAAINQAENRINFKPNLNNLLSHIIPAINPPRDNDELTPAIIRNAEHSAERLLAQSEILTRFYKNEGLNIFHGYYNVFGPNPGKVDSIDDWKCREESEEVS